MNKTKRNIYIISVILIIVVSLTYFYRVRNKNASTVSNESTQINTTPVVIRDLQSTIYTSGTIKPLKTFNVMAQNSATITEILVVEGQNVQANQVLATLDSKELKDQIYQKEISFKIDKNNYLQAKQDAEENYKKAKDKYDETKDLYSINSISKKELEEAYDSYQKAKLELDINTSDNIPTSLENKYLQFKQSESTLADLYDDLKSASILSPIDGVVTNIFFSETDYLNKNNKLFSIAILDQLEIITSVGEYDVNKIEIGMTAIITGEGFSNTYEGIVKNIGASAEKSGNETVVKVVIDIVNESKHLKPNFTANADIIIADAKSAKTVPIDAVVSNGKGKKIVRVQDNSGEVKMIPVQTGVETEVYIEIISDDINEGDQVVTNSNNPLSNKQGSGFRMFPGSGKSPKGGK